MSERFQFAAKLAAPLVLGGVALLSAMHQWEDQRLTVYADKLAGGLPTYCSGRTQPPRAVGDVLTQAQCDTIDRQTAIEYGRAVLACVPADKLDQNSFDAFTLFAINVGKQGACGSRAAQLLRDGNREAACKALARGPNGRPSWSYASGVYVQGLQNRRQYEKNWCLTLAEGQ
ncbi:lysozyme [Variovorax sp. IB41]|uniref:lysozyme n=1 Tax=Variovorax sp. IB41 TaxID=2779370 RepID=UPI0018E89FE7|nr:glycoside hydrolase family protein [Variovorax sp. IB41]MBJ2155255.1 glycoside hydrolase family protein [Variovorax sp. IB41]